PLCPLLPLFIASPPSPRVPPLPPSLLYPPCALPSLPSSPTRRSSDLAPSYGDGASELLVGRVLKPHGERVAIATKVGPHDDPRRDRKSTRLNSSHGSISYAVFCLEKKMSSN